MPAAFSDNHPTLYVVHGKAKPVLRGPNITEPNLFHHGETTYRVGRLSESAAGILKKIDVCFPPSPTKNSHIFPVRPPSSCFESPLPFFFSFSFLFSPPNFKISIQRIGDIALVDVDVDDPREPEEVDAPASFEKS